MDGAGFHPKDNADKHVPEGVYLVALPPYSPELNPIEKLWDLIQDHTANKLWPSIERLDQVEASLLKDWWEDPAKILRLVGRGWIRSSTNVSNIIIQAKLYKTGMRTLRGSEPAIAVRPGSPERLPCL